MIRTSSSWALAAAVVRVFCKDSTLWTQTTAALLALTH
jgi:hypothetical protein